MAETMETNSSGDTLTELPKSLRNKEIKLAERDLHSPTGKTPLVHGRKHPVVTCDNKPSPSDNIPSDIPPLKKRKIAENDHSEKSDDISQGLDTQSSIRMSHFLEGLGINWKDVISRRKSYMLLERFCDIAFRTTKYKMNTFVFGSQSEGTTTRGLHSDTDYLFAVPLSTLCSDVRHTHGDNPIKLLRNQDTPPQHYYLQVLCDASDEMSQNTTKFSDKYVYSVLRTGERVLRFDHVWDLILSCHSVLAPGILSCNGPATTNSSNAKTTEAKGPEKSIHIVSQDPKEAPIDSVNAYYVHGLQKEMNNFFSRKRRYNWPSPDLLEAAKQCPNFLVPSGYHFIDEKYAMWRLSPNLIERLLMFSLNCTQLKCYVILKMINKAIFQSELTSALTSFQCKTNLFFTIETTPTVLWNEENLIHLVKMCLCSLKRFLKAGVLPHFIMQGVNLFDGKLKFAECRRLYTYVSRMIKQNLKQIWRMDIDSLDRLGTQTIPQNWRMMPRQAKLYPYAVERMICSLTSLLTSLFVTLFYPNYDGITRFHMISQALRTILEHANTGDKIDKRLADGMAQHLALDLVNTVASLYIRVGKSINNSMLACYSNSFNFDVTTCRLKMASMLYCRGHMNAAMVLLEDLERIYTHDVKDLCQCFKSAKFCDVTATYSKKLLPYNSSLCVTFTAKEAYCMPPIIVHEYCTILIEKHETDTYIDKRTREIYSMSARPFLYYLQYLTYGALKVRDKQLNAFAHLANLIIDTAFLANIAAPIAEYIKCSRYSRDYIAHHFEKAINLLGHCFEMEGDFESAISVYCYSHNNYPEKSAARWHIRRLIHAELKANVPLYDD